MDKNIFIKRFRYLLLFGGFFNIIFAAPLIFPGISDYYLIFLSRINNVLHLGGQSYASPTNFLYSFFINTAGIDLVFIGAIVLYAAIDPMARRGIILLNAIGRFFFRRDSCLLCCREKYSAHCNIFQRNRFYN